MLQNGCDVTGGGFLEMMQAAVCWTSWSLWRVERLTEDQEVAIVELGSDLEVDEVGGGGGCEEEAVLVS